MPEPDINHPAEKIDETPDGQMHTSEIKLGDVDVYLTMKSPKGIRLKARLETQDLQGNPLSRKTLTIPEYDAQSPTTDSRVITLQSLLTLPNILLALAIVIYLVVHLIGLTNYPIFFFTDEAVQTVLAQDFIRDGFRGYDGELFPTFFYNSFQYNLGTSVYLQVLPYLLFGKSVFVTRATAVLATLIAALGVGLILKNNFKSRYAWVGVLLLSVSPAWFLHSRTAFETGLATSFYVGFLYFYLQYRQGRLNNLYHAIIFGALTFYSYNPAMAVVVVTAVLLFISDLRYHWQQRQTVLIGLGLALALAIPFFRFEIKHGGENINHLILLNSIVVRPVSFTEKVLLYVKEYLHGLDPRYWYLSNDVDMARHQMGMRPHLPLLSLPFALIGLGLSLWKFKRPENRIPVLALLAAPCGAALVEMGITRALIMVIPATLLAALGIDLVLKQTLKYWRYKQWLLVLPLFIGFSGWNIFLLTDALNNGALWHDNYGLSGMQYGARQVFGDIKQELQQDPHVHIILSPSWANGTDIVARFFFDDPQPFDLGSIRGYFVEYKEFKDNTLFIMTPEEYDDMLNSHKFTDINVKKVLPYPDGSPGFFYVRLTYVPNIADIMAEEREARKRLQEDTLLLDGETVKIQYSLQDMGEVKHIFDGDLNTLMRTMEANPFKVNVTYQDDQITDDISVKIGGNATRVKVVLLDKNQNEVFYTEKSFDDTPDPRLVDFNFNSNITFRSLMLEVESINSGEPAHVHLWEIIIDDSKE